MIRPSDKGPRHARPPRTKQGGRGGSAPPPSGGDGKKGWFPCLVIVAFPVGLLGLATTYLLATGAVR